MISFREFLNEVTEPSIKYVDYGKVVDSASSRRKAKVSDIAKFTKTKFEPTEKTIRGTTSTYCSIVLFISKNEKYKIIYKTEDGSGRYGSTLVLEIRNGYTSREFKLPEYSKVSKEDIVAGLKYFNELINDGGLEKYTEKFGDIEFNSTFNKLVGE